jgi:AcrR family transcriptional regulator
MGRVSDAHLEARRQSIMLAACDVFSKKGVEAATMAEIAARANISPGAIYRYFPGKEELARCCMDEGGVAVHAQWTVTPDPSNPGPSFAELARRTVAELDAPSQQMATTLYLQRILQAVFADDDGESMEEFFSEKRTIGKGIATRLKLEVDAGRLPRGLDLNALAGALYSFYIGARLTKLVAPEADIQGQLDQITALFAAASNNAVSEPAAALA